MCSFDTMDLLQCHYEDMHSAAAAQKFESVEHLTPGAKATYVVVTVIITIKPTFDPKPPHAGQ